MSGEEKPMFQVLINGEWVTVKDGDILGSAFWYELQDGSTGAAEYGMWRQVSA